MPVKRKPPSTAARSRRLITLMLVDDHPLWRKMLKKVMDNSRVAKVVAEASNGEEALRLAETSTPDVVLMDIDLPLMNGIEATRRLMEKEPTTRVLVLAASDEKSRVVSAVKAGAKGYLLKTAGSREVIDAVRRVHRGELVLPPELSDLILEELKSPTPSFRGGLKVVLADASVLFREGLSRVLKEAGFEVTAGVGEGKELVSAVESDPPDVMIVERSLPEPSDEESPSSADVIKASHPEMGVLFLSHEVDAASAVEVLSRGSRGVGYLLKDRVSNVGQLVDAIQRVAAGESVIDPDVAARLAAPRKEKNPLDELSTREREILELMAEGRSNQAIAEQLFLTPKTIEGHIGHIFMKLGLEPTPDEHRRVVAVLTYLRSV